MSRSCPDGMYPMDTSFAPEEFDSFAELKAAAEDASDSLNFPIGWTIYDADDEDWGLYLDEGVTEDTASFELVFLLPRKWGQTWGMKTANFDRREVQAWIDSFIRGEVMRWYGWTAEPEPEGAAGGGSNG